MVVSGVIEPLIWVRSKVTLRITVLITTQKPWVFIRVLNMEPTILGLLSLGFLIRFLH